MSRQPLQAAQPATRLHVNKDQENPEMTNRILCSLAAAMLAPLGLMPVPAIAQTTGDQVLYACYIPLVGVVYRIKEPGLPVACLGRNHVEFHWNAQGPRGERGEAGTPGNLLLAGQSCPTGY